MANTSAAKPAPNTTDKAENAEAKRVEYDNLADAIQNTETLSDALIILSDDALNDLAHAVSVEIVERQSAEEF